MRVFSRVRRNAEARKNAEKRASFALSVILPRQFRCLWRVLAFFRVYAWVSGFGPVFCITFFHKADARENGKLVVR